ncbi:hypothetical protein ANN_18118 [Periplaneta americana]|uniref:Uncharacterized protein n=1 Tax=Periplaneta americana TaxID=6978 RepID=A0ABQ8SPB2_PERAM|nr:hypothetical protein ANN_18118 [Periplaneta americana]
MYQRSHRRLLIKYDLGFKTTSKLAEECYEGANGLLNVFGNGVTSWFIDEKKTGDNAGEMSPGSSTESYPAFAHIGLRENPGKNLNQCIGHVLGQCPKGELLINARHHRVRHALATSLKTLNWEIHEEVHCVSSDSSFRRADIIAINGRLERALVLDPTIRFERNINEATEVDIEKKSIYEPCLPYLSQKYNVPLKQWSVIGLLFGSRCSITKFKWNYLKELHIPFDYVMSILILATNLTDAKKNDVDTLLKVRFEDSWEELDDVGFYVSASVMIQDLLLKITNMVNIFIKNQRSAENTPFSIKSFLCHCYPPFDFLAAAHVTAYSTPQVFEAVHFLYCLILNSSALYAKLLDVRWNGMHPAQQEARKESRLGATCCQRQGILASLQERTFVSRKFRILIKVPTGRERYKVTRGACKELIGLPHDCPDRMLYSPKKYCGLSLIRASWEAYVQHINICNTLLRVDDCHLHNVRDLVSEKVSALSKLNITTIDAINWSGQVEKFKYLRATVTNINDTREEIKHRINMGNACYYSVEKLLSSSVLSKNLKIRIYKTVILPVVLYGCETWTLTLREEQRLRVFENKVLMKIFGTKRDEVTGEWRKLHNTDLHALYSSPDIIRNIKSRRLRWAGHVARMGEFRNAYRVLVGSPEGKRSLGRPDVDGKIILKWI